MGRNLEKFENEWVDLPAAAAATPAGHPLDALFSGTQQRLLALLFGQPDVGFHGCELIARAGRGSGVVQRELAKFEASGLVSVRLRGKRRQYRANPASPIYAELTAMLRNTIGLAEPLREALAPLRGRIEAAFVHEPIVGRCFPVGRRALAMMVFAEESIWHELDALLPAAEGRLGRWIEFWIVEPDSLAREPGWWLGHILAQPRTWVMGDESFLGRAALAARPITCGP